MNFKIFILLIVIINLYVSIWLLVSALASVTIKFNAISKDVKIPTKRKEDAGYDIYPYFEQDYIMVKPHETVKISTGLRAIIPKGYYIQLRERGSTGSKTVIQQCGVIDSGYRGEWFVPITNGSNKYLFIAKDKDYIDNKFGTDNIILSYDKAICQATIEILVNTKVHKISSLTFQKYMNTERGTGKLGASGK